MTVKRPQNLGQVYLVRCQLRESAGILLAENVYWQSATDDDLGEAKNDEQFKTNLVRWADMSALNSMPPAVVRAKVDFVKREGNSLATITLTNPSDHIAFFLRAEVTKGPDGGEILPITYTDNYVTIFPHETCTIEAHFSSPENASWSPALRFEAYNPIQRLSGSAHAPEHGDRR
jgi:exo-1,4-beta-D-glucosaminidase